ncbi:MAG: 1-acyl-sn-glycerol-3-phosphate acyltransferase [Leptospiraceae bacterium]|nr:1-acyl-sn-glycerol-3-phosphate acyltransferase [Leptospiraceae bacterium]MDW7975370.1 lysophospholipid acyltransferase family protein [Leptospiraceae bacterium]
MQKLSIKAKTELYIQKLIGNIIFPILAILVVFYFRFVRKYKISELAKIRKFYREVHKKKEPILICPNHLTFIDSAIIAWALGGSIFYSLRFRTFPWNIPAKENVERNLLFRIIAYLTKCILFERNGTQEHKELVMNKLKYLLKKNEPVCIFIEGTRSPTGRILKDQIHYGVGQLLYEVPNTKVLVIYLRGEKQKEKSVFPEKDQKFYIQYKLLEPRTQQKGIRAHRELTLQILDELLRMENEYFSSAR